MIFLGCFKAQLRHKRGLGFWVERLGFRVCGFWFGVSGLGLGVLWVGSTIWGVGFGFSIGA